MRLSLACSLAACLALAAKPAAAFDWIGKIELDAEGIAHPSAQKRLEAMQRLQQYSPQAVKDYFLRAVKDSSDAVRKLAGQWLGKHKVLEAVPMIVPWLNEPDPQIKELAADILGQLGGPAAVKALIRSLGDVDEKVRLRAVIALGKIGTKEVVIPLVGRLEDDKHEVRTAAVKALAKIGDPRAVIPLVSAFADVSIKVRVAAIEAIGKLGDDNAVPALLRQARSPTDALRGAAVQALGDLGAVEAVDLLIEYVTGSTRYQVRNQVANALGKIARSSNARGAARKAVRALVEALGSYNHQLRQAAQEALRNAGASAVPALIASLEGKIASNPRLVVELLRDARDARATPALIAEIDRGRLSHSLVLEALSRSGDRRALVPILGLLAKPHSDIRIAAMKALRPLLGPEARAADDVLIGLLGDKDEKVQLMAAEYLGLMQSRQAVPKLLALTGEEHKLKLRLVAVTALAEIADRRATKPLLRLLRVGPDELRRPAANGLIYTRNPGSVEPLLAIAQGSNLAARTHAIRALGGVLRDRSHEAARAALEKLALDDEVEVSLVAIASLGAMKSRASGKLLAQLAGSFDLDRRRAALEALGNLGDRSHVPLLLKALRMRDDRVSSTAAWALGKLEDPVALEDLLRATRRRGWATSINASAAAARYAHIDKLDQVLPLLHHRMRQVRVNAAYLVGRLKAVPARRTLMRLLQSDPSPLVRQAAARALGQIGGANKELARAAKKDQSEAVRKTAAGSLKAAFKPPARSDWRNFTFVDPDNGNSPAKQEPYFVAASDGLVTALYTDARGEAAEEKFPPGDYVIAPKARSSQY